MNADQLKSLRRFIAAGCGIAMIGASFVSAQQHSGWFALTAFCVLLTTVCVSAWGIGRWLRVVGEATR